MPNDSEEYFDVVDNDDRIVGQLTRSEVHRRKLLHRAVHVFLFRTNGCLLIHRRADDKEEFPSVWTSSCSGHVSAGEDYDATAVRELFEELGIEAKVEPLWKFVACEETSREFTVLYCSSSNATIRPDPVEIADVKWLPVDAIQNWMTRSPEDFSPAFRLLFGWFMEQQRTPETR